MDKAQVERDRILDLSHDPICIAGMDGYLKYVNPAGERILGYTRDEFLPRPFLDFAHPDGRADTVREMDSLAYGRQTVNFENRYVHKNGRILHLSWMADGQSARSDPTR